MQAQFSNLLAHPFRVGGGPYEELTAAVGLLPDLLGHPGVAHRHLLRASGRRNEESGQLSARMNPLHLFAVLVVTDGLEMGGAGPGVFAPQMAVGVIKVTCPQERVHSLS